MISDKNRYKSPIKNIIGNKYGKLTVLEMLDERGNRNQIKYKCLCDCGREHVTTGECLRRGRSKSCGCNRIPPNKNKDREYAIKKQLFKTNIVNRSKKLNLTYDLQLDEYIKLISMPCHYCELLNSNYATDRFNSSKNNRKTSDTIVYYNGLDRINSMQGYNKNNVVPCCKYCNRAKGTMTQEEFKEWIINAYNHFCKSTPTATS